METLQPAQPEEKQPQADPTPTTEKAPDLKHIEFLSTLDMKDQLFNDETMEKISYMAERMDTPEFEELALKLGNDSWGMSKLDKMYYHVQLSDKYIKLGEQRELIKKQLQI